LIAGLWLWERRRRELGGGAPNKAGPVERVEPSLVDADIDGDEANQDPMPSVSTAAGDRISAPAGLPVFEIPADVRPELDAAPRAAVPLIERQARPRPAPTAATDDLPPRVVSEPRRIATGTEREPWLRTQPIRRSELGGEYSREAPSRSAADSSELPAGSDPVAARQRIVALRVMSDGERWPGARLMESLHAEGLVFGKYSVFHRQRDDGKAIFSIASMLEPGSFDLDAIEEQTFPGVSIFAVLPGPLDAPATFDQMLACARRMTDRLGGNLQDEHGSSLTAQRVLNLREELVHFENLLSRLRPRKP
jgi:cell division protein ZipA